MFVPLQLNSMRNRVEEQSRASYMGPCKTMSNITWLAPLRLPILVRVPSAFQSVRVDSLAPVQDASAHAHTLSNAVGIAKHVCSSTAEFNERPCKGTKHGLHTWGYAQKCKKRFSRLWEARIMIFRDLGRSKRPMLPILTILGILRIVVIFVTFPPRQRSPIVKSK